MFGRNLVSPGGGKVIQMERFLKGKGRTPLRQVEAYWTALRDDGEIPTRSRIDPRGISPALEFTFILERIAPGMARFRVAGQHLNTLAGMDVRGMPITALFTPRGRVEIGAMLERVFDGPCVAECSLSTDATWRNDRIAADLLMLPLRSDAGRVDRILGALMSTGAPKPKDGPFRFDVANVHLRNVNGDPVTDFAATEQAPKQTDGFAEADTPFKSAPYLRLVKTDNA